MQGLSALRRLGLAEQVRQELDAPALAHYTFHGPSGTLLGVFGTILWADIINKPTSTSTVKRNLHVSRQALRRFLLSEFTKSVTENAFIRWNSKLISIASSDDDNGNRDITLGFSDSSKTDVDILIGADGINSSVRRLGYKSSMSSSLEYLGVIVILGITHIPNGCFGSDNTIFESVDGKYRFYAMPHKELSIEPFSCKADENVKMYMWQLSFALPNESDALEYAKLSGTKRLIELVSSQLRHWHYPVPQLISNTPLSLLIAMPIYDRGIKSWIPDGPINSKIFVIGDAAHPMSPFKGQGANQALLDAVDLADFLFKHYSIDEKKNKKHKETNETHLNDITFSSDDSCKRSSSQSLRHTGNSNSCKISEFTLHEHFNHVEDSKKNVQLSLPSCLTRQAFLKRYCDNASLLSVDTFLEEYEYFYKKILDRVAPKIAKSRERIKRYHDQPEVLSVESYCYGPYVTPDFIAHLNAISLNASYNEYKEPLFQSIAKELKGHIERVTSKTLVSE